MAVGALPAQAAAAKAVPSGPGVTMLATERYLFVVRGDQLFQFDIDTLELRHRVSLSKGMVAGDAVRQEVSEPVEPREPEEQDAPVPAVDAAVITRALDWLAAHQDEDGHWDADAFGKHDTSGKPSGGPGNPTNDVGVTGLALLAFLGDGDTDRTGPYRGNVERAVKWLRGQQRDDGLYGSGASMTFIYGHAIATYAMAEAFGLSEDESLRASVQRGLDYLERHRNPYAVWRYQPRDNDNDTSVTIWALMAYRAGLDFGLRVNRNAMQLAGAWFDQVTDESGRTGYTRAGEPSSRHPGDHVRRFPPEAAEAMTAAGLWGRFLLGQTPREKPIMKRSAVLLLKKQPRWDDQAGTIDPYYWFFGSNAMYQMGGGWWRKWMYSLQQALVDTQRKDGNAAGSWDPVGVWGEDGGRVYATALNTLSLQSAYRFSRVTGR